MGETMAPVRKTKIICTMGPSTRDRVVLKGLLSAGMNVARFNFSHGDRSIHLAMAENLREASRETGVPVALLLDTRGPEIRTGETPGGGKIPLEEGKALRVRAGEGICSPGEIYINYPGLAGDVKPGNRIFIADGLIQLLVDGVHGDDILCRVAAGGEIGPRKNVNVPHVRVRLPSVTERDVGDIRFGAENGFDFIAASFVRKAQDIVQILRLVEGAASPMRVIAKIEDEEGLSNIDDIIRVSGGIMVARGDLGVQLEPEEIPLVQKRIIDRCHAAGKPVITATQMLESMVSNSRPTRAEVSDVANAILDGTDAVMLSGETAAGAHPVEAVSMMGRIALSVESSEEYRKKAREFFAREGGGLEVSRATCRAAYSMAGDISAAAIIAPTMSGVTPRLLSRYRPDQPIVAVTVNAAVQRQLLIDWGVQPILAPFVRDSEEMVQNAIKAAISGGFAERSDKVVLVAGLPVASALTVNAVRAYYLGKVIGRGEKGMGGRCTGRIVKAATLDEAASTLRKEGGDVLLVPTLLPDFIPIIRMAKGVIVEGVSELPWEVVRMTNPGIVLIAEVEGAMDAMEAGLTVTIDGGEQIVYEGVL
jgi:pyruvate kinase